MDSLKDKYFKRNAASVAIVEFFWGLGFPVILESTFLQIFLKNNGASDFLIGLVPSILILGISIFPLLSSYLTRNHEIKKKIVLYLHVVSSCSTLFFGVFLFFVKDETLILPAFFISYVLFSLCIGLTFPVWLHFLVKIFSVKKSVQGLSIMYLAQNIAKVIASIFIIKIVEAFSFSLTSAAWIFLCAGCCFLIGSLCFIFTKELPSKEIQPFLKDSFFRHTKDTIVEMVQNKNLLKYLLGDLDNYVVLTVISFYANYATQYFGIENYTAAGLFVCFIYSGSILSNLLLGTLDYMSLKNKFLSTKLLSLVTLAVLIYFPTFIGFLFASFLMGFCRGTRGIIYSPCIKKFCKREDTTGYFAVAPLLTIIFGSGFPVFFGKMLDQFSYLGSASYKIMFSISFCIIIITLIFGYLTNFDNEFKNTP
ncbi:MAG: MFS transporter [Desulfobacula sp.]|uniref:MFS transporter n=1 Tax=Desulfobacula sp. TaxID=2593537 RepID=UPI0025C39066|nr:MFS transporter [Desulfobacula sp.]MCD4719334.1 MFS transporter [Desulfobacula sp.]